MFGSLLGQVGRLVASPRTLGVHVCVDMSLARTSFMRREQQRGESSGSEGPAQNEPTAVLGTLREGVAVVRGYTEGGDQIRVSWRSSYHYFFLMLSFPLLLYLNFYEF